mmetsp:Transcript_26405/g.36824  ORF Transcript_26405/g.36824 Transcript_26405/m.36824 type:complete len:205 (+) Transcript_26405:28-642(+)
MARSVLQTMEGVAGVESEEIVSFSLRKRIIPCTRPHMLMKSSFVRPLMSSMVYFNRASAISAGSFTLLRTDGIETGETDFRIPCTLTEVAFLEVCGRDSLETLPAYSSLSSSSSNRRLPADPEEEGVWVWLSSSSVSASSAFSPSSPDILFRDLPGIVLAISLYALAASFSVSKLPKVVRVPSAQIFANQLIPAKYTPVYFDGL